MCCKSSSFASRENIFIHIVNDQSKQIYSEIQVKRNKSELHSFCIRTSYYSRRSVDINFDPYFFKF